jgi:hypothetical protein
MTDPHRAERLWLVMAVATWWCLRVGGEVEDRELPVPTIPPLPLPAARPAASARATAAEDRRPKPVARERAPVTRVISVFVRGRTAIINTLLRDQVLLLGRTIPEPWPTQAPAARARASPAA